MNKAKFTVIDAIIVLLVLAVLAVGIKILKPGLFSGSSKREAEFTVLVSNTQSGIGDIITPGDKVSISFSEQAFATVTEVEELPYKVNEFNEYKGNYVETVVEGRSDLKIKLKCEADVTDTKISNGGLDIRVGSEMPVRGKGYTVKGFVIELEDK